MNTTKREEFINLLLNDSYIYWLSNFMNKYNNIDNVYFLHEYRHNLTKIDESMIEYLSSLFAELYDVEHTNYYLKYNDEYYIIRSNIDGISCTKQNKSNLLY